LKRKEGKKETTNGYLTGRRFLGNQSPAKTTEKRQLTGLNTEHDKCNTKLKRSFKWELENT
jgi:hypothetical protein